MPQLHELLRQARAQSGVKQRELAQIVDIDQGHVSRIERGTRGATLDVADRWLQTCRHRLVLVDEREPSVADLSALPEDQAAMILRLARILPTLPGVLRQDLVDRVESWEATYGVPSSSPTSQDRRDNASGSSKAKSS